MKSNIEDIVDKVSYAKIYDVLSSDISDMQMIAENREIFDIVDDNFYSKISKQNKMRDAMRVYARILSANIGYMSLYLFSFIIKTCYDCTIHVYIFVKCIKSFYGNNEKQNVIMLKSLDKILSICLKESAHNDFMLYVFIKEKINIDLIKDIIIFSNKYQFNNCNSFFNILLSKLIN